MKGTQMDFRGQVKFRSERERMPYEPDFQDALPILSTSPCMSHRALPSSPLQAPAHSSPSPVGSCNWDLVSLGEAEGLCDDTRHN